MELLGGDGAWTPVGSRGQARLLDDGGAHSSDAWKRGGREEEAAAAAAARGAGWGFGF